MSFRLGPWLHFLLVIVLPLCGCAVKPTVKFIDSSTSDKFNGPVSGLTIVAPLIEPVENGKKSQPANEDFLREIAKRLDAEKVKFQIIVPSASADPWDLDSKDATTSSEGQKKQMASSSNPYLLEVVVAHRLIDARGPWRRKVYTNYEITVIELKSRRPIYRARLVQRTDSGYNIERVRVLVDAIVSRLVDDGLIGKGSKEARARSAIPAPVTDPLALP